MNKYIVIDTETGGITTDTSLLTAYFGIFDENFNFVKDLDLTLKPDDEIYHVTSDALKINKINLVEHSVCAVPYKKAKTYLYEFLQRSYQGEKLIPVGHGLNFDLLRVWQNLISKETWEDFVSYRPLDTGNAAQFLRTVGLFPNDVSGSLGSLIKYFNIESIGELHTAKVDALQTMSVLKGLISIVKK